MPGVRVHEREPAAPAPQATRTPEPVTAAITLARTGADPFRKSALPTLARSTHHDHGGTGRTTIGGDPSQHHPGHHHQDSGATHHHPGHQHQKGGSGRTIIGGDPTQHHLGHPHPKGHPGPATDGGKPKSNGLHGVQTKTVSYDFSEPTPDVTDDPSLTATGHTGFVLKLDHDKHTAHVTVRVHVTGAPKGKEKAWRKAIYEAWNGVADLVIGGVDYPISFELDYTSAKAPHDHDVQYGTSRSNEKLWGPTRAVDHEFGHMLGNKDEYTELAGGTPGGPHPGYTKGAGIMNNPDEGPKLRHFDAIRDAAAELCGKTVTIVRHK